MKTLPDVLPAKYLGRIDFGQKIRLGKRNATYMHDEEGKPLGEGFQCPGGLHRFVGMIIGEDDTYVRWKTDGFMIRWW